MISAMNRAIAGPCPAVGVGPRDRGDGGEHVLAVGQQRRRRRLVGDDPPHVARVRGDEGQRVDGASAGREDVDRPDAERVDDAVQVVRVLLHRDRAPCRSGCAPSRGDRR
jgi:hypothetical protein